MRIRSLLAGAAALAMLAGAAQAAYPERPITLIVPWGAGGGTDATGRIIATLLEEELGQPVNVVNRTGGGGVVGHTDIANADADGYTLGVITTELSMYHWLGTSPLTYEDYTLVALYNTDPGGLHVRADFPADSAAELIEMIESNPGEHAASGASQGGLAHLSLAGLLNELGIDPNAAPWIPSEGAAPSLQLLVAGTIDIVSTTLPEARSMVEAGEVKTLVHFSPTPNPAFPEVPLVEDELGVAWGLAAWRGIGGPAGLPDDVVESLEAAMDRVVESEEFREFMANTGFGVTYADAEGFEAYLAEADEVFGRAMKAAGIIE